MGGGSEVLVIQEPIVFRDDITIKVGGGWNGIQHRHDAQDAMRDAKGNW